MDEIGTTDPALPHCQTTSELISRQIQQKATTSN